MRADHSGRVSEQEFDEIFHDTVTALCTRENFAETIETTARDLVADLPTEIKQHYRPKHMAAAAVHIAARRQDNPRTVKQLASHLEDLDGIHVDSTHLTKTRRAAKKLKEVHDLHPDPVLAEDYLPVLAQQLDFSDTIVEECRNLLARIRDEYLASGRSQIAVASAAAYLASQTSKNCQVLDPGELAEIACREKKTITSNASYFQQHLDFD